MPVATQPRSLRFYETPAFRPQKLDLAYHVHGYDGEEHAFLPGHGVESIRLTGGRLHVDELEVVSPRITHESVTWAQQIAGHFTSGHLFFSGGGTELHGVVYRGTTSADAVETHVIATTIPTVTYTTQITSERCPAGTDPSNLPPGVTLQNGLVLAITYTLPSTGGGIPQPSVTLDDYDMTGNFTFSVDPKTGATLLELTTEDSTAPCLFDANLYLTGVISFDPYVPAPGFAGTIATTCADDPPLVPTSSYLWTGTPDVPPLSSGGGGVVSAQVPYNERTTIHVGAEEVVNDQGLTIAELMGLIPDSSVGTLANDLIVENMKWAISQNSNESGWLGQFFGEQPPVLSPSQQAIAQKSIDWYQGDFAKSYLGWAFANYSGPMAPEPLSSERRLKLMYFLQTGMAADKDYNTQQDGVYLEAFIQSQPRIQAYIENGAETWATELYNTITSPPQITLMVDRICGAVGVQGVMTAANNLATILSALEVANPSPTLAAKYITAVMSGVLTNTAGQSTWKDQDAVMEWLPDWLTSFLNELATSGSVPDDAQLAAKQLQDYLEFMGGNMATVASEMAGFVINANGATILKKTLNGATAFAEKYPRFSKVGNMLFLAGWCMGVIFTVQAFQNWKNLSTEDKAKAVTAAVQLGMSAIDSIPGVIGGLKSMGMTGYNKFIEWTNGPNTQGPVADMNGIADGSIQNGAQETATLLASGNIEKSLWSTFFEGFSKVVAVVGVAASAAFAVLSTMDFVHDIRSGAPIRQQVFDGIMMAANIAMTVCLFLDLLVASTVFAMAGAVFAVIGLVVALVEMFTAKPDNPLQDFMNDTIIPFIDALPPQVPPPSAPSSVLVSSRFGTPAVAYT